MLNCANPCSDQQVFAYRLGKFIVIGPEPSAQDEFVFRLANEATKHLKR